MLFYIKYIKTFLYFFLNETLWVTFPLFTDFHFKKIVYLIFLWIPILFLVNEITVKHVLRGHSKIDKTNTLMTNGSFMKVQSIAECSPWSILQYFWPALSDNPSYNPLLVFFLSGCLRQVLLYTPKNIWCYWFDVWIIRGPLIHILEPLTQWNSSQKGL